MGIYQNLKHEDNCKNLENVWGCYKEKDKRPQVESLVQGPQEQTKIKHLTALLASQESNL